MNAAYTWAIDDALRKACIEIPYPQREVRVRGLFGEEGEDALEALGLHRNVHAEPAVQTPTVNDAAEDLLRPDEPMVEPEMTTPVREGQDH